MEEISEEIKKQQEESFKREIISHELEKTDKGHSNLIDDLGDLLFLAEGLEFHDFKNTKFSTPKVELKEMADRIAKNVIHGRYDNK